MKGVIMSNSPRTIAARVGVGIVGLGLVWVTHNLTPLFWALLALIALDLLFNLHDEAVTVQRLTKALFVVLLPVGLRLVSQGATDPLTFARAGIAVALSVEVATVGPMVVARVAAWFPTGQRGSVEALLRAEVARLEAEAQAALKAAETVHATLSGDASAPAPTAMGGGSGQ